MVTPTYTSTSTSSSTSTFTFSPPTGVDAAAAAVLEAHIGEASVWDQGCNTVGTENSVMSAATRSGEGLLDGAVTQARYSDAAVFSIRGTGGADDGGAIANTLVDTVRTLRAKPMDKAAFTRAQHVALSSAYERLETDAARYQSLVEAVRAGSTHVETGERLGKAIAGLKAADVHKAAVKLFNPAAVAVVAVGRSSDVPSRAALVDSLSKK